MIVNGSEACDAGPAGSATCNPNCTVKVDTCPACRAANCTNYQGALNVVAGCFDATATGTGIRAPFVGAAFSAAQVQACVDVVNCARANNCAYNPANRVNPCYCGNITVDACNVSGPLAGQPCTAYVKAAVGDTAATPVSNTDTLLRISDLGYPMGWAYFLLECDGTKCDGAASGDCTP